MKYCKKCGSENRDENQFCFNCGCDGFAAEKPEITDGTDKPASFVPAGAPQNVMTPNPVYQNQTPVNRAPVPPGQPARPYPQPVYYPRPQKKPLTIPDLLSILGFVAALVGMFAASVILHPVAAISSLIGFLNDTKFKPLAVAGFVISIVGGVVYIVISLYRSGLIPQWITFGAFH